VGCQPGDTRCEVWRMRILPAPPQEWIGFGGVEIKPVTVRCEERDSLLSRVPGPRFPVEPLDYSELGFQ
jgi:hypothetical protein